MGSKQARKVFRWILLIFLLISIWKLQFPSHLIKPLILLFGVIGTFLMFSSELFYTMRKEKRFRFGKVRRWLQVHIVIGIVGPTFILLHSRFNIHGFSGLVLIFTLIVVISGFFGRYVFKLIPKSIKGKQQTLQHLKAQEEELTGKLKDLSKGSNEVDWLLRKSNLTPESDKKGFVFFLKTNIRYFQSRLDFYRYMFGMTSNERMASREFALVFYQRLYLERRIELFHIAKSLFRGWKILHIPLTVSLFITIIVHIFGVFYYGKLI